MSHPKIEQQITFFYTKDINQTAEFYENLMGLELVLDQGDCRIYQICENGFLGFCQRETAPDRPHGVLFTLVTPEVDAWYDYLKAKNAVFDAPPALNPKYNIYHCFLNDPNGYKIEIQRFNDNWSGTGPTCA